MKTTKFALIGAGFIGQVHARNLAANPAIDFKYVADIDAARAKQTGATFGAQAVSVDEVIGKDVDAVLIASSTNTHADLAEKCAAKGKAIYCEKPIDLSLERVRKAVDAIGKAGVPFMIGFNRRFDQSHAAVESHVRAGEVGKIEIVQLTSRGPDVPPISYVKISGGQMRDQTIHFFDLLRWLTQDEPVEVFAMGDALIDPEVGKAGDVDTSIVSLRMSKGGFCQIDSSRRTKYGYDERLEVFGSEGMAESSRQQHRFSTVYKGKAIRNDGMHAGWFERVEESYYSALDAFVRNIQGEKTTIPGLKDGLRAQIIADAAAESLKTGKPVKIS